VDDRVVIRPAREADVPQILAIERVSFSTPWTESTFRGLLERPDAEVLAAEANGRVVGYAAWWVVVDQAELGNIAVAPEWRRLGVGTRLLESVIERVRERGVRELFLEVRVSNTGAQELYQRHGFREVGRRRSYYVAPVEDALVMCKLLDV
jgi:ribosomal-protein-alanine N-acetyltransferase